jgi:hypothetical protein
MDNDSKLNKPLIIFTFVIVIIGGTYSEFSEPQYYSDQGAFIAGIIMLIISPIFIIWTKALWNNIIPRITNWRAIDFWEALGISTFIFFMIG